MVRALSAILAALIMITVLPQKAAAAEKPVVRITLDEQPKAAPTPAEQVWQRMSRRGMIDGKQWSIHLIFQDATVQNVLDYLVETAMAEPRKINMVVDRLEIENAGVNLQDTMSIDVRELSLAQALGLVLPRELTAVVNEDGLVLITSRAKAYEILPTVIYDITEVLRTLESDDTAAEDVLRELLERQVRAGEPWDTMGGRAMIQFAGRGRMIVQQTHAGHRAVRDFCLNLLRATKLRQDAAVAQLTIIDRELSVLRAERAHRQNAADKWLILGGRPRTLLRQEAVMAEAAQLRGKLERLREEIAGKQAALNKIDEIILRDKQNDAGANESLTEKQTALVVELAELQGRAEALAAQSESLNLQHLRHIEQNIINMEADQDELDWQIAALVARRREFWAESRGLDPHAAAEHAEQWLPGTDGQVGENEQRLANDNAVFAWSLFKQLSPTDDPMAAARSNMVIAPHTISSAMAMLSAGAGGETADEIRRTMGFQLPPETLHPAMNWLNTVMTRSAGDRLQLNMAASLWHRPELQLRPEFATLMAQHYGAACRTLTIDSDGDADSMPINQWVRKETNGQIADLVEQHLDAASGLVLAMAFAFDGHWKLEFPAARTEKQWFITLEARDFGSKLPSVKMMRSLGRYRHMESDDLQIVELPYAGGAASMFIILPELSDGGDVTMAQWDALLAQCRHDRIQKLLSQMRLDDVDVRLPRFDLTCTAELSAALRQMGMAKAFAADQANFAPMAELPKDQPLYLAQIAHKVRLSVNQRGTKAAAGVAATMTWDDRQYQDFNVNRPFVFFVRHNVTGAILLAGRIMNPAE